MLSALNGSGTENNDPHELVRSLSHTYPLRTDYGLFDSASNWGNVRSRAIHPGSCLMLRPLALTSQNINVVFAHFCVDMR